MMDYVLFGAIAGDVCGSSYEAKFGRTKLYEAVRLVRTGNDFTDDTVCTIGVANAILKYKNPTPEQFGECIQEKCVRNILIEDMEECSVKWIDNPVPYGSYGNGSAMRVSPVLDSMHITQMNVLNLPRTLPYVLIMTQRE